MTLRQRLARLEARKGGETDAEAAGATARLVEMLGRIEAAVVASGDASDRLDASPVERAVRRYLRGDADPGEALRDMMAGRWP